MHRKRRPEIRLFGWKPNKVLSMSDSQKKIQVFGLGQCCLDYIGKVKEYPAPDAKCEFTDLVVQGGGPVATALVALARWRVCCAFAGVVGDDRFGGLIKDSLDREGIDTTGLLVRRGFASQFAFIVAEPGVGRRTIFWRRPTGPSLKPEEINGSLLEKAEVLHIDGHFGETTFAACSRAKKAGLKIVADADTFHEGMLEVARWSDYFIASETFAASVAGEGKPVEACRRIADLGPRVAAVTRGARGYVALDGGKVIQRPAFPVEAIDTTGCGDVFHAGFIYGLIRRWSHEKSFDFAAWAAARVSLQMGGRNGIPSLAEIEERGFK
jgi:sulfofructose kinase